MRLYSFSLPGFSLVEVTVALGVGALCLIAVFGLLPIGLQTNQAAIGQSAAVSILSSVTADLRATPKANSTSTQFGITFGTATTLYFDGEGRRVDPTTPNANPRYRLTISFPPSPAGTFAPTFVTLKVTWPALSDPATTRPAGLVDTFAAFDRH